MNQYFKSISFKERQTKVQQTARVVFWLFLFYVGLDYNYSGSDFLTWKLIKIFCDFCLFVTGKGGRKL